jgi:hypothetical protein
MTADEARSFGGDYRDVMRSAGITEAFIERALTTPSEQMWYPSFTELQDAGVTTSRSFGERFAVSGTLLANSSPESIDKLLQDQRTFRAMKLLEPLLYDRMVKDFSLAVQAGKTEAEAFATARGTLARVVVKYLPRASDDALLATRDYYVELLERLRGSHSLECVRLLLSETTGKQYNYAQMIPEYPAEKELEVTEQVLSSASNPTMVAGRLSVRQAEADLEHVRAELRSTYGKDAYLLGEKEKWLDNSERICEMTLSFYRGTMTFPRSRQVNLLRHIFSE